MSLFLLGISHRTAPIDERETLAVPEERLAAALEQLLATPGVAEGMILSTCNRVEVLVETGGDAPDLLTFLSRWFERDLSPLATRFYTHAGEAAVRHVFRVASSLDSLVVGEPQILGQFKQAYAAAMDAGTVGPNLGGLAQAAWRAAKRVRTETEIADQPVSVSSAAVELARQIFGDLHNKTVLLLGAGAMGELAARHLLAQGAARLLITNRTLARAQAIAAKYGGEAFSLDELRALGEVADVVISCTGAPHPLITRADAAHFLARRRQRPMLFLDLAVPRDVEPSVHQLDNAFVYNVDDLDKVVASNLDGRRREAERGERIVQAEVDRYLQRESARDAVPTVRALLRHAEDLRRLEWERIRSRLGPLSVDQEGAIEALTRTLMQKWLHSPLVELRSVATPTERRELLEAVRRLFQLPEEMPDSGAESAQDAESNPPSSRPTAARAGRG